MRICFVTPELTPLAKVGGLADVSTALPAALSQLGHEVTVVLPWYQDLKLGEDEQPQLVDELADVLVDFGPRQVSFSGYESTFPDASGGASGPLPKLLLIRCDEFFGRPGIYGDAHDESLRFMMLSRAALHCCQRLQWPPDIIHTNDWQTAMVPLLLKSVFGWDQLFQSTASILTIHNIGHQGVFSSDALPFLSLGEHEHLLHQEDLSRGIINFLKTGLMYANQITAVSPTYSRQIQTEEYGSGLEDFLAARRQELSGILNGIDTHEWNPAIDPLIPSNYTAECLEGKAKNKQALHEKMGLDCDLTAPLLGVVTRLASQKGIDLMKSALPGILRDRNVRLVVLGSGQQEYVDFFEHLIKEFPGKVGFYHGFNNALAHLIEAGSDMFLMPSLYEPCGLNQMYSQAYGTPPIVRKTGGLADTVEHFLPSTGKGTGFVFEHYSPDGLSWAINTALEVFESPESWNRLIQNCMSLDYSWQTQAEEYVALYETASQKT